MVEEELGRKRVTLAPKSAGIKIDVKPSKVATSSFQRCSLLRVSRTQEASFVKADAEDLLNTYCTNSFY